MNDSDTNGILGLENAKPFPIKGTDYNYDKVVKNNPSTPQGGNSAAQAAKESKGSDC